MNTAERNFARIDTALKGYLRVIPDGRLIPLFSCTKSCGMPSPLADLAQTELPEALLQFLGAMDDKLNSILGLLNRQALNEDFPIPILVRNLSGAGLCFNTKEEFALGTAVEAIIALDSHSQVIAGTIGHINRRDEHNGQVVWAMEFRDIRDSEREKIIQYVIAQQREQIRDKKNLLSQDSHL
ncbi:MAG: PilZ domain-containing protein [Desulfomicrobium sp.]|jgi:hypothetical protein|nr:PilZ domain-containing protein [Desulfomicrobium sp.]NLV97584.1 PilZ domain-containing protein [Desulfovibrionales bacterium]